jgi:hypothetical protein
VRVDEDKRIRIVGASNFELSLVTFELDIALREEELGVIFVEDTVRDAGAIDATVDLDICTIVGLGEVSREATVVGDGQFALDGCSEDSVEGEEEEVVISCSGVGSLSISGRRSSFHSAEAGGHSLKAMVWKELELEEHEEPEDVGDVSLLEDRLGFPFEGEDENDFEVE